MIVNVGIFWAIDGEVYAYFETRETNKLTEREKQSGRVDSDLEHFAAWDKELAKRFFDADFATFPRGRVMFDTNKNRHIIYADRCITVEQVVRVKGLFQTINAQVCRDEHYRCDKCMKK